MQWYTPFRTPLWIRNEIVNRWWARRHAILSDMLTVERYIFPGEPIVTPTFRHLVDNQLFCAVVFILGQDERLAYVSETAIRCNALLKKRCGRR